MAKAQAAAPESASILPPTLDIRKVIEQFKIPGLDMKTLLESSRKDVEAVVAANEHAYRAMDALVRRQAELVAATLGEWQNGTKDLLTGKSAAETAARQATQVQQNLERVLGNVREMAEFVAKSHEEVTGIINNRIKQGMEEFKERVKVQS